MSKKNSIALAVAAETLARFKQLVVDLNDEMKKRNLIFLHMSAEKVFEPMNDDFKSFKTATEYLNAFRHKFTSKITMDEITFLLDLNASESPAICARSSSLMSSRRMATTICVPSGSSSRRSLQLKRRLRSRTTLTRSSVRLRSFRRSSPSLKLDQHYKSKGANKND